MASQSGLKVECLTDATANSNRLDIHDSDNAIWHHGTARNVSLGVAPFNTAATRAVTASSTTIHFASGVITAADVRRPITSLIGTNHLFKGGTFIKAFVNATTATLSQAACATYGTAPSISCNTTTAVGGKVEHTNNRWLVDATCAAGTSTVTTTAPGFAATDIGKTVSGGPFSAGTYIISIGGVGNVTATLNTTHTNACTTNNNGDTTANPDVLPIVGADKIAIGTGTYSGGVPVWNSVDPMGLMLSRTSLGGTGFTCAGGNILGMTAAAKADTGGFVATDVGLQATVRTTVGATVTTYTTPKITAANTTGNTTVTVAAGKCPALAAPTSTTFAQAWIGVPGAGAPSTNDAMMTLGAELNLSPGLVATADDCDKQTLEGFMVVGGWVNPGASYANNAATPVATVAQITFPTSVISFNGFIAPKKGGETNAPYANPDPHYTFTFPLLPSSLAVCTDKNETLVVTDDHPLNSAGLTLGMNSSVLAKAPFLPTGSGNVGDPGVRGLVALTTPFDITVQQINNTSGVISTNNSTCTPVVNTADPGFTCGNG